MRMIFCIWLAVAASLWGTGLEFSEQIKEIDAAADATTATADFSFTNKSDKPITIAKADPTCSCLKVQISGGKLKYQPGESGVIRTTFEMGNFSGTVDKVLAIFLDKDPANKPSVQLTMRVHIPVLVGIEPKTVKWEIGGKPDPQTVQIRMAEGKTIHVTRVKSSADNFKCELKTLEEGKKYDLVVTPLTMGAPALAVIRIETDCEVSRHKVQQAFAVVRKPSPAETAPKP